MEEDPINKAATGRGSLRSRAIANHMQNSEESATTVSTAWSGHPEWMVGCLARLYQSEDLCDVTLDVGLRSVSEAF